LPWPTVEINGQPTVLDPAAYRGTIFNADQEVRRKAFEAVTTTLSHFEGTAGAIAFGFLSGTASKRGRAITRAHSNTRSRQMSASRSLTSLPVSAGSIAPPSTMSLLQALSKRCVARLREKLDTLLIVQEIFALPS
jgi:hypothetical protein